MIVVCVILIYFFRMIFKFLEIFTKIMLKSGCVSNECTNGVISYIYFMIAGMNL